MLRQVREQLLGSQKRQRRTLTLVAALFAIIGLLGGGGGRQVVHGYESLTTTDRLTAFSMLLSGRNASAIPVTLVAVDDETRARWGNPVIVPHPAIAALIGVAQASQAFAILVDFDLSSDSPAAAADASLMKFLQDYPAAAPPLLLVRIIRFSSVPKNGEGPAVVADSVRVTPYDAVIAAKPNIFWVSALPELGSDRAVRQVRLWQTICNGVAGDSYPSPALLTAALVSKPPRLDDLKRFLQARVDHECGRKPLAAMAWPPRQTQSVSVPYSLVNNAPQRFLQLGAWSFVSVDKDQVAVTGEADPHPFQNRIVLIGATHADSHDSYLTPVGNMAGVKILANTMAMAKPMVEAPEASWFARSLAAILLFICFALFAAWFQGVVAAILICVLGVGSLIVLARLLDFGAAVEILALGLTLFALFKILDAISSIAYDWRAGRGWRAILKHSAASSGGH